MDIWARHFLLLLRLKYFQTKGSSDLLDEPFKFRTVEEEIYCIESIKCIGRVPMQPIIDNYETEELRDEAFSAIIRNYHIQPHYRNGYWSKAKLAFCYDVSEDFEICSYLFIKRNSILKTK